jgi:putative redox protein
MSKLSPALKPFFEKMIDDLTRQGERLVTQSAEATLVEDQRSEVKVRGFTLVQDEPEYAMGGGKGPTPTDFFMASVALCENVIFARNAALRGVSIDSLETVASGTWDLKGTFEVDGADPSFRSIQVETRVKTASPVSEVVDVAVLTHRRCPIHATLRKATALSFRLSVNGADVPLTREPASDTDDA